MRMRGTYIIITSYEWWVRSNEISNIIMMMELNELWLAWLLWVMSYYKELRDVEQYELGVCELWHYEERRSYAMRSIMTYVLRRGVVWWRCMELLMNTVHKHVYTTMTCCSIATNQWRRDPRRVWTNSHDRPRRPGNATVTSEINTYPTSFYRGRGGGRSASRPPL